MTALLIILAAIVLLAIGYVTYGSWLAKEWGIDPTKKTPAIEMEDGVDYVAAPPAVLMGHHFSSIAGAGPINGPIQASVFGWVPVFLWCIIGGIFFGGLQTSVPCLPPSVMKVSPLVRSSRTPWAREHRSCSPSLPCWC